MGLKVYKLISSDGSEACYTTAFRIYMDQDRSVVDLLEKDNLMDKGYKVHKDNWYSPPSLFHHM